MRRVGPEVVDLSFKMRCFGLFEPQNTKKLRFSLLKQCLDHETRRRQHNLWSQRNQAWWEEEEGEEQIEESDTRTLGEPGSEEEESGVQGT